MSVRFRSASSACSPFSQWMKSPAKWMALTPRWVIEECASTPVKVATQVDLAPVRLLLSERVFRWAVRKAATPIEREEASV